METLKEVSQRKWFGPAVAAVLGLALGLVYAWGINPVEWTDATPELLRSDYQTDYLKAAIDSYSVNRDVDLAVARYQSLGQYAQTTLEGIQAAPGEVNPAAVEEFAATVTLYPTTPGVTSTATTTSPTPSATQFLLPVCGVTVVLGLLLGGVLLIRSRGARRAPRPESTFGETEPSEPYVPYESPMAPARAAGLDRPPLATFRTTYSLGDDLYDDSFSIEGATGDFLGECGVGIGDLIGVGEPKKVSAFEVWLDKNVFNGHQSADEPLRSQDDASRNRLAARRRSWPGPGGRR
jgi:hypothetical protein